jgi:hypothetical protein
MSYAMKQYDMNDKKTRQRVFWLLKRLTSRTLWGKKRDAWEIFARAYENAVKTWPKSQPEQMEADNLPRIYDILSLYNKGLDELNKGYRFVWRIDQPLYEAERGNGTISNNLYREPEYWERGMQMATYPPKVEGLHKLILASQYQGDQSPLEVSYLPHRGAVWSGPANLLDANRYKYEFYDLPYPVFPDSLPEVPEGANVIIQSGQTVPIDGIWEPVKVRQGRLLGIIPIGEKATENNGCFNYFVKETKAPRITGEYNEATSRTERVSAHWRLLWEDTRYKDGIVPDESEYFLEPKASPQIPATSDPGEVRTGEFCPLSGLWAVKGYEVPPIRVSAGTVMPDLMVRDNLGEQKVHWVTWQLVKRD